MLTAKQVAEYFLANQDEGTGERIGNLKLQKLCYYAQGLSLAMHGYALFPDQIKAWDQGPVIPSVDHEYKGFYSIPVPTIKAETYPMWVRNVLDMVINTYGMQDGWTLREMTHEENPWRSAYQKGQSAVITHSALSAYFKERIAFFQEGHSRPLDKNKVRDMLLADAELAKLTALGIEDFEAGRYQKLD